MTRDIVAPRPGRTGVILLAGWLFLGFLGPAGCAHVSPWRKSGPAAPATVPDETEPAGPPYPQAGTDEPTVPAPPEIESGKVANKDKSKQTETSSPPKPRTVASPPAVAPPPEPVPQPPDSSGTSTILSEDIPEEERVALIRAAGRDLDETEALLRTIEPVRLTGRGGEQLRTIQALMKASREAGDRSEFREAASLAHKAWLLAVALSGR